MRFLGVATVILAVSALASTDVVPLVPATVPAGERLLSDPLPAALDGRLALVYRVARREGRPSKGEHWLLGRTADSAGVRVNLQLRETPGDGLAGKLAGAGCVLDHLDSGGLANVGPVLGARCSWQALWTLASMPEVRRVEPTFGYRLIRPTVPPADTSGRDVEASPLSEAFYPDAGSGKGVLVCDMDTGVDPFHPFFFRADGGAYEWLDVNGNGAFDPGIDAVDFNRNGVADPGETLALIKAPLLRYDWYSGQISYYNLEPTFVAGYDWLFQDENGNGLRDQGKSAPYGDAKPTFGEQTYVADDVNGNGKLDLGERVLRLNTPQIKAVRTPVTSGGAAQVYTRGSNLAQVPEPNSGDWEHGSMVLGTIAGGAPYATRFGGIAPEADLCLGATDSSNLLPQLAWAKQLGAQVVLWEMATWYGEYLDGSSSLEVACDSAADQGVLQIAAAGNLGGSQKHRVMTHAPGTQTVSLVVPGGQATFVYGDFLWRQQSGGAFAFTIHVNGQAVALSGSSGNVDASGTAVYWTSTTSSRQTHMLVFYLSVTTGTIAGQTVTFDVVNSGSAAPLHGYVTDSYTAWEKGVSWPVADGATDVGTYGTPAVGDKTLAVASYFASLAPSGVAPGELANYSGQGPRLDGADTVDFAAPEDHVSASVGVGAPFGALWVGGGTSNALPVAAGVAALLRELAPAATPLQVADAMRAQALTTASMGTIPNDVWGHGKLRAYRAHFVGAPAPTVVAPTASGRVDRVAGAQWHLDASASSDPQAQPLRYRWDLDYDGVFDLETTAPATTVAEAAPDVKWVKLEVIDAAGRSSRAVVHVGEVGADGGSPDAGSPDGGGPAPGGSPVAEPKVPDQLGTAVGCGCAEPGTGSGGRVLLALAAAVFGMRRRRAL